MVLSCKRVAMQEGSNVVTVRDLFIRGCFEWDVELVYDIFDPDDASSILKLPAGHTELLLT
ncbi:conserved hypothetical protein [Ricinus communis]|uniref:Uncharacterized protein n=1 Tax=Ricinus communis TaxID=3988 RepID=B9RW16_RICCO|nr:conserved hypothetical protein [Ricinus communis]